MGLFDEIKGDPQPFSVKRHRTRYKVGLMWTVFACSVLQTFENLYRLCGPEEVGVQIKLKEKMPFPWHARADENIPLPLISNRNEHEGSIEVSKMAERYQTGGIFALHEHKEQFLLVVWLLTPPESMLRKIENLWMERFDCLDNLQHIILSGKGSDEDPYMLGDDDFLIWKNEPPVELLDVFKSFTSAVFDATKEAALEEIDLLKSLPRRLA